MFLKQRPLNQRSPSQEGYTILEGLMAVVVVSVMLLAIGPVIAFSVGTRVQAKRVELATQAGKSYIDWVKAASDPNAIKERAPKQTAITAPATGDLTSDCTSKDGYCTTTDKKLYCVNLDETAGCQTNSPVDMVVQPIITSPDATKPENGYGMQVRVYRANSFAPGVALQQSPTKSDSLTTNALGNRGLPLVMMKTEVLPSGATFENLRDRLQGTP